MNVAYAYAVDGLHPEGRKAFDAVLAALAAGDRVESPARARQQMQAQQELMAAMGAARG